MSECVSVLITSYNRTELLQASIESLRECTYFPYELIIHDDGSNQQTIDFLLDIHKRGWISTLILNPPMHNRGQALGADRCFAMAQGSFVAKMEGDEEYTPGWLTKSVCALKMYPEIGILSLQQFYHHHDRDTAGAYVNYPDWDKLELATFNREGVKISVVWCSPGGQFITTWETWNKFKPWWHGHPEQETIEFRARVCPMFRLLAHSHSRQYPAVTDKVAHWKEYKNTRWLAALDPPVVSSHWGGGKGSLPEARPTIQKGPRLHSRLGEIPPVPAERGAVFGPMKGYNFGANLDRFGDIHIFHPMREAWNAQIRERKK